ncbi:putative acetyltransferase At3g50280 [Silene latifolia]|uniref:putative acetyltransferase At3g50280 n=1 Tax=Silene latifolia TaxID=37657 RepID=UPI003D77B96F
MASNDVEVKLISKCFVKPKSQVEESKTPHYLLGTDLKWLSIRYIQTGFLYNKPITKDFDINAFVEKLKQSLSHALVYYYPLAGRFTTVTYEDEHACSIYVDCNKGPGARFIHASCVHATVSDIAGYSNNMLPAIGPFCNLGEVELVCYDGHTRALLSLQVTELKDGVCVGITMNHSIGDGSSFIHFVNSLSEICRSLIDQEQTIPLSLMPIFKPFLPQGCNLLQKLPYLEPNEFISRVDNDPRLKEKIFHFSLSSISNLKKRVNSEWPEGLGKISSFQALAALIWISINRAQKKSAQAIAVCIMPVNCRALYNPPLSPAQFGNHAQQLVIVRKVGELIENGLVQAAVVIHQGILGYDHKVAAQRLKAMMENPTVLCLDESGENKDEINVVNFTWSSKFDIYGVDFGLGKPMAARNASSSKRDGRVVIRMARDGIGSIDLEVSLCSETMMALELDQEFMEFASSF